MEEMLGPLSVLYSWQSLLLAFGVASLTHVVKGALDLKLGGKEERQRRLWAHRVVLPMTPLALGAVGGAVVPLHPEALTEYLTLHTVVGFKYYLALMAYGGAVGQFSDYVWHRYSGITDAVKQRKKARQSPRRLPDGFSPTPDETEAPEPAEGASEAPVTPVPVPSPAPAAPTASIQPSAVPTVLSPEAKPLRMPDGFAPPPAVAPAPVVAPAVPASGAVAPSENSSLTLPRRRRSAFRR